MTVPIFAGGAGNLAIKSLEFGTNDYLSMSNANWGTYDRTQFSIIGSVYVISGSICEVFTRGLTGGALLGLEISVIFNLGGGIVTVQVRNAGNNTTTTGAFPVSGGISTGTWYAYKIDYDGGQATAADRMIVTVNNSTVSPAGSYSWPTELNATTNSTYIGDNPVTADTSNCRIFQPTFISGSNPSNSSVFNGTDGKIYNTAAFTGLYSRIGGKLTPEDDDVRPDWTNNGGVVISGDVP